MISRLIKILYTVPPAGLVLLAMTYAVSDAQAEEIIVDNTSTETEQTGGWWPSSGADPYMGGSVFSDKWGKFTWLAGLHATGDYAVYAWWTYHPNRSRQVPYRIQDGATLDARVIVDQGDRSMGGQWNFLGRYKFNTPYARITVSAENGQANADAVRLVTAEEPVAGQIVGFYSAVQERKTIAAGEWGSVVSTCDPGDYAVSGGILITPSYGADLSLFKARIRYSGLIIHDPNRHVESWILEVVNESPPPIGASIGVSARCADFAY